jgi:hypothetical protein
MRNANQKTATNNQSDINKIKVRKELLLLLLWFVMLQLMNEWCNKYEDEINAGKYILSENNSWC